jgi:hypothetical protein
LLTIDGKGELDQDIFILNNNFWTKYEQFLEAYNGGQSVMVLIKNVTTTSKGYWYLKAQHYIILTHVNETIWVHLLQFHSELSSV